MPGFICLTLSDPHLKSIEIDSPKITRREGESVVVVRHPPDILFSLRMRIGQSQTNESVNEIFGITLAKQFSLRYIIGPGYADCDTVFV